MLHAVVSCPAEFWFNRLAYSKMIWVGASKDIAIIVGGCATQDAR